ncbi:MAG: heavy-metal-associated domain-containing protein [Candidatus Nitronauta litoralis]|uniref:Heavy-metal-associated domain-containing protein n=1 Tax=Candidatus Nitronauta litoralis TaxID=2705533 RepID=A0A7T0G1E8_9BACT|nr:MAG: heavy-metal-associated domain-containing protein [Candidatus Nitronauta litoralis]
MAQEILKVEGMTCGHCAETVTKAVQGLAGIQSVNVDLDKKEVAVEFDETATPLEKVSSAITGVGFEVVS